MTFIDPTETRRDDRSQVRVFVEVPNPGGVYRAGLSASVKIRPGTAPPADAGDLIDAATEAVPDAAGDLLGDLVPVFPQAGPAGSARERTAFRPGPRDDADAAERADVPRTRRYADDPSRR